MDLFVAEDSPWKRADPAEHLTPHNTHFSAEGGVWVCLEAGGGRAVRLCALVFWLLAGPTVVNKLAFFFIPNEF